MINKYAIPNEYGFSRYRDIANFAFTEPLNGTIDESKITYKVSNVSLEELAILMQPSSEREKHKKGLDFLSEFTDEQKDVILTFFGYTMAYALYLNQKADPNNAKRDRDARFEADQLYKELTRKNNLLFQISFSLGKDEEEKESMRIKDRYTLREILEAIKPIIKERASKEKHRGGKDRNSFRKKLLESLVPLFKFLEHETHFKGKTKNYIAEWILTNIDPIIIRKYTNLNLDLIDCVEMLIDYRKSQKNIYQMKLV